MTHLLSPFRLRGTTFRNRVWVSPMCRGSNSHTPGARGRRRSRGTAAVRSSPAGWTTVGASAIGYADWPAPHALTSAEIADLVQAERILADGDADAVLLARALLRGPNWAQHAGHILGADAPRPDRYQRVRPS